MKDRDKRLKQLDARLAPREPPDRQTLRLALEQRVENWRAILRAHPRQGRMVLLQLVGPIMRHSDGDRPAWIAKPRPGGLLAGMVYGTSPTGLARFTWWSALDE